MPTPPPAQFGQIGPSGPLPAMGPAPLRFTHRPRPAAGSTAIGPRRGARRPLIIGAIAAVVLLLAAGITGLTVALLPKGLSREAQAALDGYTQLIAEGRFTEAKAVTPNLSLPGAGTAFLDDPAASGRTGAPSDFSYELIDPDGDDAEPLGEVGPEQRLVRVSYVVGGEPAANDLRIEDRGAEGVTIVDPLIVAVGVAPQVGGDVAVGEARITVSDEEILAADPLNSGFEATKYELLFPGDYEMSGDYGAWFDSAPAEVRAIPLTAANSFLLSSALDSSIPRALGLAKIDAQATDSLVAEVERIVGASLAACFTSAPSSLAYSPTDGTVCGAIGGSYMAYSYYVSQGTSVTWQITPPKVDVTGASYAALDGTADATWTPSFPGWPSSASIPIDFRGRITIVDGKVQLSAQHA